MKKFLCVGTILLIFCAAPSKKAPPRFDGGGPTPTCPGCPACLTGSYGGNGLGQHLGDTDTDGLEKKLPNDIVYLAALIGILRRVKR